MLKSPPHKLQITDPEELRKAFRANNKYSLSETEVRNMLVIGRTRTGKSTLVGVLKDPCHTPKEMSIFSDTYSPQFTTCAVHNPNNGQVYTLNIFDTPGLKEIRRPNGNSNFNSAVEPESRSDEVILAAVRQALKHEITFLNVVMFCISFKAGLISEDLESLSTVLKNFFHESITIIICVTRSEDKDDKARLLIEQQLRSHQVFANLLQHKNIKIAFAGCVESENYHIKSLYKLYTNVSKMRNRILDLIFDSVGRVAFKDIFENLTVLKNTQSNAVQDKMTHILNKSGLQLNQGNYTGLLSPSITTTSTTTITTSTTASTTTITTVTTTITRNSLTPSPMPITSSLESPKDPFYFLPIPSPPTQLPSHPTPLKQPPTQMQTPIQQPTQLTPKQPLTQQPSQLTPPKQSPTQVQQLTQPTQPTPPKQPPTQMQTPIQQPTQLTPKQPLTQMQQEPTQPTPPKQLSQLTPLNLSQNAECVTHKGLETTPRKNTELANPKPGNHASTVRLQIFAMFFIALVSAIYIKRM